MDCSKTFYGDDFKMHITCVSEAEKYEGSLYKKKETKRNPQEVWMEAVSAAVANAANAPENIRYHLLKISSLGNVPRNKNKFGNFLKNSFKIYSDSVINGIWEFLEKTAKKALQEANETTNSGTASSSKRQHENSEVNNDKKGIKSEETVGNEVGEVSEAAAEDMSEAKKNKKKKRDRAVECSGANEVGEASEAAAEDMSESKKSKKKKRARASLLEE